MKEGEFWGYRSSTAITFGHVSAISSDSDEGITLMVTLAYARWTTSLRVSLILSDLNERRKGEFLHTEVGQQTER